MCNQRKFHDGWPSWVIDWSDARVPFLFRGDHNASRSIRFFWPPENSTADDGLLILQGVHVDKIVGCSPILHASEVDAERSLHNVEDRLAAATWLADALDFISEAPCLLETYHTRERCEEAISSAVTVGAINMII